MSQVLGHREQYGVSFESELEYRVVNSIIFFAKIEIVLNTNFSFEPAIKNTDE
jgi:hypothetical protein